MVSRTAASLSKVSTFVKLITLTNIKMSTQTPISDHSLAEATPSTWTAPDHKANIKMALQRTLH
jgi:hypothetical protein